VTSDSLDYDQLAAITANFAAVGGPPGIAYGVVFDGKLVHAGGLGERALGTGEVPGSETIFRIASMSKSFTASTLMTLRDEGLVELDAPAADYVAELRGWQPLTPDSGPITVRRLLTMTAGFPTDDPWGDRQQGMPLDDFGKLLADGVSRAWAPATRFEYSNLGYAILGRVISEATGMPYRDVVTCRLLEPLGMSSTGFEAAQFPAGRLAVGYQRDGDEWQELPFEPYGAFAPMGGFFSSVSDLARWVAGFAGAFPPDGNGDSHPVSRASRREMQLPQVLASARPWPVSYGFGLFVEEDPIWGRVVTHSGGYPGFGSNMRWHPETGTGVIALGNATYTPMTALAGKLLHAVLSSRTRPGALALAPAPRPWAATLAAQQSVNGLLRTWDDAVAEEVFAPNVAADAPYAERARSIATLRDRIGDFRPDDGRPAESDTSAHRRWWVTGPRGSAQIQILLSPQSPPLVQYLAIAVPPAGDSALARAVNGIVTWLNDGGEWELAVAPGTDAGRLARRLRMAAGWAGRCRTAGWRAGDGEVSATVELVGEHATVQLTVGVDPSSGAIRQAAVGGLPDGTDPRD
jgi:CubicO group peptidase (beta-lactamase class C family)